MGVRVRFLYVQSLFKTSNPSKFRGKNEKAFYSGCLKGKSITNTAAEHHYKFLALNHVLPPHCSWIFLCVTIFCFFEGDQSHRYWSFAWTYKCLTSCQQARRGVLFGLSMDELFFLTFCFVHHIDIQYVCFLVFPVA